MSYYEGVFDNYLDRVGSFENMNANDQLVSTFSKALQGIQSYKKALSFINSKVESPTLVLEFVSSL